MATTFFRTVPIEMGMVARVARTLIFEMVSCAELGRQGDAIPFAGEFGGGGLVDPGNVWRLVGAD